MADFPDPIAAFRDAMAQAGLTPPANPVADGQLHRFHVEGDRRSARNGWYVLYPDDPPAGAFGCWKRGIRETWSARPEREMDTESLEAWRRRMDEARRAREAEERCVREQAASRAQRLWKRAAAPDPAHPYLARKGVQAHGIRQLGDLLVVPVASSGAIAGLQFISADGGKRFLKGTPKRGRYHPIGKPNGTLAIAEGYATAASIHEATGLAAVVAFDAGNLPPVAEAIRGRFPKAHIIIAGDNDRHTEGNPGATAATKAAEAVRGTVALPAFGPEEEGTDWNDVAASRGPSAVAEGVVPDLLPRAIRVGELPPPAPVEFAVDTLATAREPVLIVSDDGAGKTTLLLAMLCAMAADEPVFDRFDVTPGPVLLVSEEDPGNVLANHAEAIARGHRWDWSRIRDQLHVLALAGVQLDQETWRQHILEEAQRIGAVAVGLDPYADLTNAKENDNDETRPFKAFLRELGKAGATPIVCHHAGKAAEGKRKRDRIRGASALTAAARSILFLEETEGGVAVESLKLSRSVRPAPFVVSREIESEAGNPANWRSARLSYVTAREATEDTAEAFILDQLDRYETLKSTELRELAKGSGLSGADISGAQKRLELTGQIEYEPGPRNSKNWSRTTLSEDEGQARQGTLSTLSDPAGQAREASDHPAPLDREGRVGQEPDRVGQTDSHPALELESSDDER